MTDIPIKAKVECTDGPCGKSTHIIADPASDKVTHIVIKDKKLPDSPDRLVPVEKIADTTGGVIRLNCAREELADLPPFTTVHYVQKQIPDYADAYVTGDPSLASIPTPENSWVDTATDEHIPTGELALARGMAVQSKESKKVGHVDGLVVDPDSGKITHLLMQKGHLWGKKDVALPVVAIDFVDADTVYLKLDKAAVKALPTVPVK
jgi:sporulation protein YlmC with PRC-barrel domain